LLPYKNLSPHLNSRTPYFPLLHTLCDSAALVLAWQIAFELRVLMNPFMAIQMTRPLMHQVAPPLTAIIALWLLTVMGRKTYYRHADESLAAGLLRVAESAAVVSSITLILTFASGRFGPGMSRSFILLFVPISFVSLTLSFFATTATARRIEPWWPGKKRIAILGFGGLAQEVVEAFGMSSGNGASLRGMILPEFALAGVVTPETGSIAPTTLPVLGTTRDLAAVINREGLDRIIFACDTLTEPEAEHCAEVLQRMGVTVSRPISTVIRDAHVRYQHEYGLHLVDLQAPPFTAWQDAIKRATDVVLSLMLLVVLSPLLALIAVLISLTSEGPVFYCSRRVGKGGRYFSFWKFRSMRCDGPARSELSAHNDTNGHLFKLRQDPRVTPVGRLLRRTSMDELPQLFNVLAGEMSLVGPRPLPAEDLDPDGMSAKFREWAEQRSRVRPGITGLWQIKGRSDIPFDGMVELDVQYIREWSLRLDWSILLATPRAVISGRGAY
jgi:exopolysaccharide biosynthesis polyprenyl glycosylphosphotransferase